MCQSHSAEDGREERRPCYAHRVLWWRKTTEKEIGIFLNTQRRRCLIWDTRGRGGEKREHPSPFFPSTSLTPQRIARPTYIKTDRESNFGVFVFRLDDPPSLPLLTYNRTRRRKTEGISPHPSPPPMSQSRAGRKEEAFYPPTSSFLFLWY